MNSRTVLLVALTLALASMGCQPPAQEVAGLPEEDRAALEGIMQEYARSALAGDMDAWAGLWAEDGVEMNPKAPAIVGREAIREHTAAVTITDFTVSVDEVHGRGDLAYVRGTFSVTMTAEGMPEPRSEDGKYLTILRKSPGGTWLIGIDCWNSNLPLREGNAGAEE